MSQNVNSRFGFIEAHNADADRVQRLNDILIYLRDIPKIELENVMTIFANITIDLTCCNLF